MSDPTMPAPRRRSWLLILSLCLNVALAAMIVIGVFRAAHPPGSPLGPRALIAHFPDAQPAIQKIADAHEAKLEALREAGRRARHDALRVIAAPDYSPARMMEALHRINLADSAAEAETVAMMSEAVSALPQADRAALADRLERHSKSWLYRTFKPRER